MALRAIFTRRGWDVRIAPTIAEARIILPLRPRYLILDLMLPDGDGAGILQQIRTQGLPIRVAVTTGSSDHHRLKAVTDLRPDVILTKPISLPELLQGLGIA
jgi:DNA-binding response OmpR family regulator